MDGYACTMETAVLVDELRQWEVRSTENVLYPFYFTAKQEQVLAMFPYTAQNPDELTFYKGSVINVLSKQGEWWTGEMNGQTGMFPSNYVQPLSDVKVGTTQCK